jgi:hypothetical protein
MFGPTHDLGYEPDQFDVRTILAVPAVVAVTGVLAFGITWLLFSNIFDPKINNPPAEVPQAAERNAAPLNDRFARISSTDPNAEVQQPRLEGLQKTVRYKPDPKSDYELSAEMTTMQPTKEGNPPRVHADDLRPEKYPELTTGKTDPQTGLPELKLNRRAIADLLSGEHLKARKGALPLDDADWNSPKESNGGNAKLPAPPKQEPGKKNAEKKEPGK